MQVQINNNKYELKTTFLTCLYYKLEAGCSVFDTNLVQFETLVKLIYVAIRGEKPYFYQFEKDCRSDSLFLKTAIDFVKKLLHNNYDGKNTEALSGERTDEFSIIALCCICNIPESLFDILNIFDLMEVITRYIKIKNVNSGALEMTQEQVKTLYNIDDVKEKEIEQYVLSNKEVMGF